MTRRTFRNALYSGIPFGLILGLLALVALPPVFALLLGLVSGSAFGFTLASFLETQRQQMESKDGTFEEELLVFQGPANHFLKAEGRGGTKNAKNPRKFF